MPDILNKSKTRIFLTKPKPHTLAVKIGKILQNDYSSDKLIKVRREVISKVKCELETVTVTSKGQITIPADLRRRLEITKGTKLILIREGKAFKMIPVPKLSQLAGIDKEVFKGRKPSEELEKMRKEWTREFEERLEES